MATNGHKHLLQDRRRIEFNDCIGSGAASEPAVMLAKPLVFMVTEKAQHAAPASHVVLAAEHPMVYGQP